MAALSSAFNTAPPHVVDTHNMLSNAAFRINYSQTAGHAAVHRCSLPGSVQMRGGAGGALRVEVEVGGGVEPPQSQKHPDQV